MKALRVVRLLPGLSFLALLGLGCGGAETDGNQTEGRLHRTIVRFDPNGKPSVSAREITLEEQRSEVAARKRRMSGQSDASIESTLQGIQVDDTCDASSLWLFDQPGQQGNEICFYGAGTAWLNEYLRGFRCFFCPPQTWMNAVRSYWAGEEDGDFVWYSGELISTESFIAWQRVDNAGYMASHSSRVDLFF